MGIERMNNSPNGKFQPLQHTCLNLKIYKIYKIYTLTIDILTVTFELIIIQLQLFDNAQND